MENNNLHEKADLLWKPIIEDFIVEVIAYFYPTLVVTLNPLPKFRGFRTTRQ